MGNKKKVLKSKEKYLKAKVVASTISILFAVASGLSLGTAIIAEDNRNQLDQQCEYQMTKLKEDTNYILEKNRMQAKNNENYENGIIGYLRYKNNKAYYNSDKYAYTLRNETELQNKDIQKLESVYEKKKELNKIYNSGMITGLSTSAVMLGASLKLYGINRKLDEIENSK